MPSSLIPSELIVCARGEEHFEVGFPRNGVSMPGSSKEWGLHALLGFKYSSGVGITPVLGPWWGFASQGEIPKGFPGWQKSKLLLNCFWWDVKTSRC